MTDLPEIDSILKQALLEDVGKGDITTGAIVPGSHKSKAHLIARENFILAGLPFAEQIFRLVCPTLRFKANKKDGDLVKEGSVIAKITGSTRGLLTGERTSLNFMQRLSGISTLTRRFLDQIEGLPVKILDTRKTTPGLRLFEKYAVRVGGGHNHRFGLFDGILIKDNHIKAVGSIKKAVRLVRENAGHIPEVEVEVENIREVRRVLASDADIIMLDNMPLKDIKRAVIIIRRQNPGVVIEASGNIKLENIRAVAETGVDRISIGALTHSAVAVDISMDVIPLH
ncbi:MAG: carboxylating nicotinate-nucleotide diphosphorylase [Candidatus Mariimomonas ferrooxydans]